MKRTEHTREWRRAGSLLLAAALTLLCACDDSGGGNAPAGAAITPAPAPAPAIALSAEETQAVQWMQHRFDNVNPQLGQLRTITAQRYRDGITFVQSHAGDPSAYPRVVHVALLPMGKGSFVLFMDWLDPLPRDLGFELLDKEAAVMARQEETVYASVSPGLFHVTNFFLLTAGAVAPPEHHASDALTITGDPAAIKTLRLFREGKCIQEIEILLGIPFVQEIVPTTQMAIPGEGPGAKMSFEDIWGPPPEARKPSR